MTVALVLVESDEQRLTELARDLGREYTFALDGLRATLAHAINCGEILIEARKICQESSWYPWLDTNFPGRYATAAQWMRYARNKERLQAAGINGLTQARELLKSIDIDHGLRKHPVEALIEGERLWKNGATQEAAAREAGIPKSALHNWIYRNKRKRAAKSRASRQSAAARVLARQEQARAAKRIGGDVSKAHSQYRLLAETLQSVGEQSTNPAARKEISTALNGLYRCGDAINRAIALWE